MQLLGRCKGWHVFDIPMLYPLRTFGSRNIKCSIKWMTWKWSNKIIVIIKYDIYIYISLAMYSSYETMICSTSREWSTICTLACFLFRYGLISPICIDLIQLEPVSLTHWGRDKMDAISQTTFSSAFSWMKMFEFRLKFHWSLFLRVQLTIFNHWFR